MANCLVLLGDTFQPPDKCHFVQGAGSQMRLDQDSCQMLHWQQHNAHRMHGCSQRKQIIASIRTFRSCALWRQCLSAVA